MERFMKMISGEMTRPKWFGWYHIMCLVLVIGLTLMMFCLRNKINDKAFRIICASIGTLMILFEVLKQLHNAYDVDTNTWEYDWYYFPFQFCSVPMYVLVLIGCLKDCKFRTVLCEFLATFGLFGGALVMLYPGDVFTRSILINIHTMVHHGLMVVMGALMYFSGNAKAKHKTIINGIIVFAVIVTIAFISNIIAGQLHLDRFNLFYIGPYKRCHLTVLSDIWDALKLTGTSITFGNFVFLLIYVLGFGVASYLTLLVAIFINFIYKKIQKKNN